MNDLIIQCTHRIARINGVNLTCRVGKKGVTPERFGTEGDEKTPLGSYKLRWGFYRADRIPKPPQSSIRPLNWRALKENDGWCDDIESEAYNRFIRTPSAESHEALWREDGAYDIILVMSHNDSPPEIGKGSAVFIHIAQADNRDTLGCVAFAPEDMVKLLPHLQMGMNIQITD